ncbi:hypothetical protein Acr_08g0003170 [Actinidia rufa]|uniref:EF-hand domain-containing protein n=1 Tax=Actinidia rufa TaxID=165716 RepID=A0A7J0EZQ7_9ERIC|nr:hypothetical protein Acr_08g0003170 [Actinidia rufa]
MEILHSVILLIFAVGKVQSRSLRLELNSSELVSDGVNNADYQSPFLSLNSLSLNGLFSSSEPCEHYYGFFPCADNFGGYLFQIVVYEYLLATGEKFLTKGNKQLFNLIGTGFFGDVFEILMVLPEILVVLKSGVTTDKETSVTAGIMLLSLIPFLILQLSAIINTSSGDRKVILIALIVSISGLLAYFAYQIFSHGFRKRSLEYTKYENLRTGFLQHMERHATGKLVTNEGKPNISVIKRLALGDKEYAVAEVLNSFDVNQDGTITKDEFIAGCKKWIHEHEAKKSDEHGSSHSRKYLHQVVVQGWFEKRRHELAKISFENIDKNNNKYISESELKELIQNIKFGKAQPDPAMVVESVMKDFDKDGDHMISEQEFVRESQNGFTMTPV